MKIMKTATNTVKRYAIVMMIVSGMILPLSAVAQQNSQGSKDNIIVVTLLGTGTPLHSDGRRGFSNLVQAGGLFLLIDAGRGAVQSLGDMRIPVGKIDATFITHYHSDHINGLPDIFMMGYVSAPVLGGRKNAFQLYGPEGVEGLARGLEKAYEADAKIRLADEPGTPKEATWIEAHTVKEGVIFEKNGVKVTMFNVDHGELIKPSVGYRVDYAGRSVVFSGDTKFDENVIKNAKGVDLLVHEVFSVPPK